MEAVRTSETSANFDVTTLCYIPEDSKLHTRRHENLKSHLIQRCSYLQQLRSYGSFRMYAGKQYQSRQFITLFCEVHLITLQNVCHSFQCTA
jgi:hypothetical protein